MQTCPIIAVTLGSNGFHLFEVVEDQGKIETKNHLYENVQAESYLDDEAMFSDEGTSIILAALRKFGNHIMLNHGCVAVAIATGSFRRAKNADTVIKAAGQELGVPIRVLSGQDEGLLCYLGIASSVRFAEHNRLVLDIGGGSTEL